MHKTTTYTTYNFISRHNQTIPFYTNPLEKNVFLVNLTKLFHVTSIPLAIFILITICILCLTLLLVIILCIRTCIHRKYIPKSYKKKDKPVYVDDIPGLGKSNDTLLHNYGTIEYSLNYNLEEEELTICIIQANNLLLSNVNDTLNAYATISLVTNEDTTEITTTNNNNVNQLITDQSIKFYGKQYRTDILHHTNRPCWNQSFMYKIEKNKLKFIIIILEIYHYNDTYIDQCLGKLEISLEHIDHSEYAGKYLEKIDWLSMHQLNIIDIGELCIGLGYFPNKSCIDICIFEGKNLLLNNYLNKNYNWKWWKLSTNIELDMIISIKYKQRYLQKCKTHTRKELINPYFNEKFSFIIKEKHLNTSTIIIQLRQIEKWRYKQVIGEIQIGYNVTQWKGTKHWEEMLNTPDKLHVRWHTILPVTMKSIPYFIDWPCFDEFW
ncbi:hypothetical protein MN116_005399 [Schistosoma mekongi]|uniref:C2 domain-containing protein n=1 Tax=Schistosoma mekongi TaxID=38744 RepID=A0AAE1ZEJ5_SCHME|nr:hypothetical protein MN116_005399 [Schistosoma mekongi]